MSKYLRAFILCSVGFAVLPQPGLAGESPATASEKPQALVAERDGQHDFDFEIGSWSTHLLRLRSPLSGAADWVDYEGTTIVRKVMNGRANLVELTVEGPAGRIEGLSLRLYQPQARQWTLNFANIADGLLTQPMTGAFSKGQGEFYAQDTFKGRAILVRFLISPLGPDSWRFEQAFSADGGKTWEINWVATDTRRTDAPARATQ